MNSRKTLIPMLLVGIALIAPSVSFAQEKTASSKTEEKKVETYTFTRILKQGMYGKDVYGLQNVLTDLKLYNGLNTGIFGPKTTTTINAFKKTHNLPTNGIVDQATIAALDEISSAELVFDAGEKKKTQDVALKNTATTAPVLKEATPAATNTLVATPTTPIAANLATPMSASITGMATTSAPEMRMMTTADTATTQQVTTPEATDPAITEPVTRTCFVSATETLLECDNENAFLEYVGKVQNKKAVVRIFAKNLTANSVVTIKPIIEGKASKWMLNVGNSKYNDGWGGGSAQDPYNAEFQIIDGILGVFKGDNDSKVVTGAKTLFARDISNSIQDAEMKISQGTFELITKNDKPVVVKDKNLFVFETPLKERKDIYIGLNRTIFDEDRIGTGIKGVMVTITEQPATTEAAQ